MPITSGEQQVTERGIAIRWSRFTVRAWAAAGIRREVPCYERGPPQVRSARLQTRGVDTGPLPDVICHAAYHLFGSVPVS